MEFDASESGTVQWVRIATEDTRESMETVLEHLIAGHRREYYFSPESRYYTYIVRPEMIPITQEKSLENHDFSLLLLVIIT